MTYISHIMFCTSLLELIDCNVATKILINVSEGSNKKLFTFLFVKMDTSGYEFPIINSPAIVNISLKRTKTAQL